MAEKNYMLVQIDLATGKTRFNFPKDVNELRGRKIHQFEFIDSTLAAKTPNDVDNSDSTNYGKMYVTLQIEGREAVKNRPAGTLIAANRNGNVPNLGGVVVDWDKSFIDLSSALSDLTHGDAATFGIIYE